AERSFAAVQAAWAEAPATLARAEDMLRIDEIWQSALDAAYQRDLALRLACASSPQVLDAPATRPEVQAAFCIDVRSEPMRRALEAVWPGMRTLGF
ncbi:putative inorganic carbon transporter subunit DabA, partial [Acinetobacter baumannii]